MTETFPFLCPRCGHDLAAMATHEGVEVDFCGGCHGVFFDSGESAHWLEMCNDLPELEASLEMAVETSMRCPRCCEPMQELPFHPEHALLIDRCVSCAGLFFDAKEIPKAEAIAAGLEEPASKVLHALNFLGSQGYSALVIRKSN